MEYGLRKSGLCYKGYVQLCGEVHIKRSKYRGTPFCKKYSVKYAKRWNFFLFQVSWIRRKDYHLLTVGLATYSSDDRFFTAHVHNPQVGTDTRWRMLHVTGNSALSGNIVFVFLKILMKTIVKCEIKSYKRGNIWITSQWDAFVKPLLVWKAIIITCLQRQLFSIQNAYAIVYCHPWAVWLHCTLSHYVINCKNFGKRYWT